MNTSKEHIKVLSTLSLAASDTREDTLDSVIISTLYDVNEVEHNDLLKWIEENFNFEPYAEEIDESVKRLTKTGKLEITPKSTLRLTSD